MLYGGMNNFKEWLLKNLGIGIGVIVLLGGILFFLRVDLVSRVRAIESARQMLVSQKAAIESRGLLKSDLEKSGPYYNLINNVLPIKDELVNVPGDLDAIARAHRGSFGINLGAETAPTIASPGHIQFKMTATGSYQDVIRFLDSVKASRYLVKYLDIHVTQKGNVFEESVNGQIFYQVK